MRQTTAFRLSTYLTMGIAFAALGYAESTMLPEVGLFSIAVLLALAVIYRLETRVQLLTLSDANRMGAGIGLIAILWAGFRIVREVKLGEFAALGWSAFIVSLIAPVLMAAVCAKMLRREKHAGDYWFIHAAGLAAIVLAGAMAEQALLVVLTSAYAFAAIWSLTLFFHARTSGKVPTIPGRQLSTIAARAVETPTSGSAGFSRALLWSLLAAILALPIYLVTPRSTFGKLDFGQPRIEIGYAADQMIDLNKTGNLRDNPETAFEVTAANRDGQPKLDLNPSQRWRGRILATYSGGAWRPDSQVPLPTAPAILPAIGAWSPPNLGPEAYSLTYTVPSKLGSLFLADPVEWERNGPTPAAHLLSDGRTLPWVPASLFNGRSHGSAIFQAEGAAEVRYVQYTRPSAEKDLSPPYLSLGEINRGLRLNPVPGVKDYADKVIAEMVAVGRLPAAVLNRDAIRMLPLELYHEAIARAFQDHLSERPDLVYTTALKRENKTVDPVEDFLLYSKAGHCERFASALVLMLRSQDIPAVMVLGFKGCEEQGNGKYIVRQEYAHAWVEALISRPDLAKQQRVWHWLTLDPSPGQVASSTDTGSALKEVRATFERFIFHYTPEQRERAIRSIFDGLSTTEVLLTGAGLVLAFPLVRSLRRRLARSRAASHARSARWYERLLATLTPHGFHPAPGETPREFALAAEATLRQRPETAEFAAVPSEWVEAHYRQRFGGTSIPDEQLRALNFRLDALKLALQRKS